MGKDYYKLLGLTNKSATEDEIKAAYKKQALKWHPDRHRQDKEEATRKFKEVSEAYEVLSDKDRRAIYDQFGEEGLKGGAGMPGGAGMGGFPGGAGMGGFPGGGTFHFTSSGGGPGGFRPSNAEDIFSAFFGGGGLDELLGGGRRGHHAGGGGNPFASAAGGGGIPGGFPGAGRPGFNRAQTGGARPPVPEQKESVTTKLALSLEDLHNGITKKLKVTRKLIDRSTGMTVPEQKELVINVKPGWKAGTKLTFSDYGDELSNGSFQDIVIIIEEKPHDKFKRDGDDLHHTLHLTLAEALLGGWEKTIPTIDGKGLKVSDKILFGASAADTIVQQGMSKIIANHGMPITKKPGTKGNLVIDFAVDMPAKLTPAKRELLRQALAS
ncbi:DnaJ-domain-containing protein [Ramicandelaber brevisporus]|nr:DnaJ-domain-containing protein [Ramicandelaber brevisporus]